MKKPAHISKYLPAAGAGFVVLAIWEGAVRIFGISSYILPAPSAVAAAFFHQPGLIGFHTLITLSTALSGLFLAVILGAFVAICIDRFRIVKNIMYPYLVVSQTIPIIAIYPLLLLWFGYGVVPKIVVVILVCFFPVCVNFIDGLARTDTDLINLFRSMNAGGMRLFFWVKLPASLPYFFSGLKIAVTYSIIGAVIGEWLGSEYGLGVYMLRSYKAFSTPRVFAAIVVVILASLAAVGTVIAFERIFVSWNLHKGEKT